MKYKDIKDNYHIGCIVVFVIAAICLSVYLISENRKFEQAELQKRLNDTARIERAWRIADSIHHKQLMEDPDYAELYERFDDLKSRLKNISQYVDDAEGSLEYFESKGFDVSDLQGILDDIKCECE